MRRQLAATAIRVFATGENSAPASNRNRPVSQTGLVPSPLESLSFQSLFPLAGFRGQDEVREAQFAPECSASAAPSTDSARKGPFDMLMLKREERAWGAHAALYLGNGRAIHLARAIGRLVICDVREFSPENDTESWLRLNARIV